MDATIKQITISKKLAFVLSIINSEIIIHSKSLEILRVRNFIPAFSFPYKYFLNIINTIIFKTVIREMTTRLSERFILQK